MHRYMVEIKGQSGELDVILGHKDYILKGYNRNNIKLVGGWYYRSIRHNVDLLYQVISKYEIKKLNFIGSSKSCSGAIILCKGLRELGVSIPMNLFLFSAYTTVDRAVYEKRKLLNVIPGSLSGFWTTQFYNKGMIRRMEARALVDMDGVHMYLFFPEYSSTGEAILASRVKGGNVTHLPIPVSMHNSLYPFWKKVEANRTIELYESEMKEIPPKDFNFYSKMQEHEDFYFHLYSCLADPKKFSKKFTSFVREYRKLFPRH